MLPRRRVMEGRRRPTPARRPKKADFNRHERSITPTPPEGFRPFHPSRMRRRARSNYEQLPYCARASWRRKLMKLPVVEKLKSPGRLEQSLAF